MAIGPRCGCWTTGRPGQPRRFGRFCDRRRCRRAACLDPQRPVDRGRHPGRGSSLGALALTHCTLTPGRGLAIDGAARRPDLPSLVAELPNADLQVELDRCISGPLCLPHEIGGLQIRDSILHSPAKAEVVAEDDRTNVLELGLDEDQTAPAVTREACNLVPRRLSSVRRSSAAQSCAGSSWLQRLFSRIRFRPSAARPAAPLQLRARGPPKCPAAIAASRIWPWPALLKAGMNSAEELSAAQRAAVLARLTPTFTSTCYGEPAYAQLSLACARGNPHRRGGRLGNGRFQPSQAAATSRQSAGGAGGVPPFRTG